MSDGALALGVLRWEELHTKLGYSMPNVESVKVTLGEVRFSFCISIIRHTTVIADHIYCKIKARFSTHPRASQWPTSCCRSRSVALVACL